LKQADQCRFVFRYRYLIIALSAIFITWASGKQFERKPHFIYAHGGIIRGDSTKKELSLIFTGGDYADGGEHIADVLNSHDIQAGFFFTGDFYRNPDNLNLIRRLSTDGHYLGPHSDQHLLYCAWENRDSLLVTRAEFINDMAANYAVMEEMKINSPEVRLFIPPFEWYNDTITVWAREQGWILFNFTPGTLSHADYTTPPMKNYRSSDIIWDSIVNYEQNAARGLNGFLLLIHIGTHPERIDKFYYRLEQLIEHLYAKGYQFRRIDQILSDE